MNDSTVRVVFLGDSDSATRAVGHLDSRVGGLDKRMRDLKRGAVIGFAAIGTAIALATRSAIGFDKSMRNVNSIARLQEAQFQKLEKRVLSLAKVSGQAPKVLADGLYDIVSSGFAADKAIGILRESAISATAGLTDTATASAAIVASLNAWKLPAGQAKNVASDLFKTVQLGVVTFPELAQQMGDLTALAPAMGISLQEVTGAFAELTKQGGPAAEHATRVKSVIQSLLQPSKGLAAATKSLGYENTSAGLKAKGFAGFLNEVYDSTKGNKTEIAKLFPNVRALAGFYGLTGTHAKETAKFIRDMNKAFKDGNEHNRAFAEQGKSIAVQWGKATAALDAAGIKLGTTLFPVLATAITKVADFAGWLDTLAGKPTIHAKVDFAIDSAKAAAADLKKILDDALFGKQRAVKPQNIGLPIGQIDQRTGPGLVDQVGKSLRGQNWSAIGISIGAAIGSSIVISRDALGRLSNSLVAWVNGPGGHQAGEVGATIALNIVSSLLDPVFWAHHWQLMLGIAIAVFPVARIARLGVLFADLGFKSFGVTVGRLVTAALGRLPGVVGEMAPRFASAVGKFIAEALTIGISASIKLVLGIVNAISGAFGRTLGPLVKIALNTGLVAAIAGAAGAAYGAAVNFGKQIADGIMDGLGNIKDRIVSAVTPQFLEGSAPNTTNVSRFGTKSPSAKIPHKAAGDIIDRPMLAMIGEDAPNHPEWVIPSNPRYRARALGLLGQASAALGLPGFAKGGGPGSGHHYTGHQTRPRGAVNLKGVVGKARSSLTRLAQIQQGVQDAQRSFDQTDRAFGITNEALTMDVPDDPSDPTNTGTHSVRNEAGIAAHVGELNQLVGLKGGIIKLLEDEKQAIEDAIKAVQEAIAELLEAIKDLQAKAKSEGATARQEHRDAAADSASVSKKGGLADQLRVEQGKKKPNKGVIARLQSAIRDAGRSHDDHENAAKRAETFQGRYQKSAEDKAGKVSDLRGSLADLGKQRHDLPYDIQDQRLDVQQIQSDIAATQATTSGSYTPSVAEPADTGGADPGAGTIADAVSSDILEQLARYREALGLQASQLGILQGFPSFERGTLYVPNDMVANLHAGESVRTRGQTRGDMASQTSGPVQVNIMLSGALEQLADFIDVRVESATPTIVSKIGRSADTLRREGRVN